MEAVQLLDAMKRIDYLPKRHFYLFPAPGPTAAHPSAAGVTSLTWFEDHDPFTKNTGAADFVASFVQKARDAGLPYPVAEYQAASEFAAWQMLEAAAKGAGKLDDKAMAAWLKANKVQTVLGVRSFEGKFNSSAPDTKLKQVQGGKWVTVWPAKFRPPSGALQGS
jgi:branched-chain amino acid transport system substrate-binding protein